MSRLTNSRPYAERAMTENDALPPAGDSPDAAQEPVTDFQTAFWSAKHALALASATAFSRHGVHEGQQFVLRSLWAEDGLTPGEVARRLGLATPTVTRATTRMEAAGLLRREPHPSDGRMVKLRLTSRGGAWRRSSTRRSASSPNGRSPP